MFCNEGTERDALSRRRRGRAKFLSLRPNLKVNPEFCDAIEQETEEELRGWYPAAYNESQWTQERPAVSISCRGTVSHSGVHYLEFNTALPTTSKQNTQLFYCPYCLPGSLYVISRRLSITCFDRCLSGYLRNPIVSSNHPGDV